MPLAQHARRPADMHERQEELNENLEAIRELVRAQAFGVDWRGGPQLAFESCCTFFLAGHSLDELKRNAQRYCCADARMTMRLLHERAEKPGGLRSYLEGILEMQRVVVSSGQIWVADSHVKDEARPFAEGKEGMHARLVHAPIAWQLAHEKAGPHGADDWPSVLARADAAIDQEHEELRGGSRPSVNKLYLRLGALYSPMLKAGMFKGDTEEQAQELRDMSIFLTMLDVATLEWMERGSCLFGMGAVDRNLLGFSNSPLCSEAGTIDGRLQEICIGHNELVEVIKSGVQYELLIGAGCKDGGISDLIRYSVTKPTDLSMPLASAGSGGSNGVPNILEQGTIGAGFDAALAHVGYYHPAFNMAVMGTTFPEVLQPGSRGLRARATLVRTLLHTLFANNVSVAKRGGREGRWLAFKDGSDGQGVLMKGWPILMKTETPVGGRTMHGLASCKSSFE